MDDSAGAAVRLRPTSSLWLKSAGVRMRPCFLAALMALLIRVPAAGAASHDGWFAHRLSGQDRGGSHSFGLLRRTPGIQLVLDQGPNARRLHKGQAVDVKRVGRELGVRYDLEGSVRKAGGRVRITAQLIDAISGTHLWADRFDGPLDDIFELQDKVAISVAGVIEPALQATEMRRSAGTPDRRPHRIRSLPARPRDYLSNNKGTDFRSTGIIQTGDRDRSALRSRAGLGSGLLYAARD
jgi:hypothetical protein